MKLRKNTPDAFKISQERFTPDLCKWKTASGSSCFACSFQARCPVAAPIVALCPKRAWSGNTLRIALGKIGTMKGLFLGLAQLLPNSQRNPTWLLLLCSDPSFERGQVSRLQCGLIGPSQSSTQDAWQDFAKTRPVCSGQRVASVRLTSFNKKS